MRQENYLEALGDQAEEVGHGPKRPMGGIMDQSETWKSIWAMAHRHRQIYTFASGTSGVAKEGRGGGGDRPGRNHILSPLGIET